MKAAHAEAAGRATSPRPTRACGRVRRRSTSSAARTRRDFAEPAHTRGARRPRRRRHVDPSSPATDPPVAPAADPNAAGHGAVPANPSHRAGAHDLSVEELEATPARPGTRPRARPPPAPARRRSPSGPSSTSAAASCAALDAELAELGQRSATACWPTSGGSTTKPRPWARTPTMPTRSSTPAPSARRASSRRCRPTSTCCGGSAPISRTASSR